MTKPRLTKEDPRRLYRLLCRYFSSQLNNPESVKPQPEVYQMFRTRKFLPIFLALCFLASVSCELETGPSTPTNRCDLVSQENEQRAYKRDDYFPKRYSRDFSRDLGADISPTDDDYDLARKVSRSVFQLEFAGRVGTGWLIAPRYVVTAAHNVTGRCDASTMYEKRKIDATAHVHTFDGDTIDAEVVWFDKACYAASGTDLALLKLEREINAVPMKIADRRPGRNETLMAMGHGSTSRGLGAWTVSAGPALELRSEDTGSRQPGRVYHWVPTAGGMSGGPVFNRSGEVVSIVSVTATHEIASDFGIRRFQKPSSPPENLWVYGFYQSPSSHVNSGPNPGELKDLYNKNPGLSEPANAGDYRNNNEWKRVRHPFGDHYSPFPIDQFDRMNEVYKEARKGTVTISTKSRGKEGCIECTPDLRASGFIYNESTVITAGHLAWRVGLRVEIKTIDGQIHPATVSKRQDGNGCDIGVIKTDTPGALRGDTKLDIGDSSSLECGDPLVMIGSGNLYKAAGDLQGLGAVYMTTRKYTSEFFSRASSDGMSGGPVVDRDGNVVSVNAYSFGDVSDEWDKPGPLHIHTRLPVYGQQSGSRGQNSETMKKFVDQSDFYCTP